MPDLDDATQRLGTESNASKARLDRGVVVDRYTVVDVVGEGGMGVVYKAYDPELDRPVALKLLHTREGGASPTHGRAARERLLREAQALARLSHPNVVAVYDVGTFGDDVFLATEFVEGMTLRKWLAAATRTSSDILRVFAAAGEGLAAAHRAGLVHRDVKPENVIVGNDGRVRVLDFGLARTLEPTPRADDEALAASPDAAARQHAPSSGKTPVLGSSVHPSASSLTSSGASALLGTQLTEAGAILGTPRYMSPEQHLGAPLDARSDQFSFAISLYEAMTGGLPFDDSSRAKLRTSVVRGRIREIPAYLALPRWLRALLAKGLAPDPDARFPSMDALLDALRRGERLRRRRWIAAGVALASLLTVGLVVRVVTHRPEPACHNGARHVAGVWNGTRRDALVAAFRAVGTAYADDAQRFVVGQLDAFRGKWIAAYTDACEATRVRGDQSEELLDLRMACLGRRLDDVKTQVEVFLAADKGTVERAAAAVANIGDLEACADGTALRARVRPPSSPEARARVEALTASLSKARGEHLAGRMQAASSAARAIATDAAATGYRPLEAEALTLLGDTLDETGDYAQSEATLRRASRTADMARDDTLAIAALTSLGWVLGEREGKLAEAQEIALDADAKLERAGRPRGLDARVARLLGTIAYRLGKYDEARRESERGLHLRRALAGTDRDVDVGWLLGDLADIARREEHNEEALGRYDEALAILVDVLGPSHPTLAYLESSRALSLLRLHRLEEASAATEHAIALWEAQLGPNSPAVAAGVANLAETRNLQGRLDEAAALNYRALAILEATVGKDHPNTGSVLRNTANLEMRRGHYAEAAALFARALVVVQKWPDHPDAASIREGAEEARKALRGHLPPASKP